MGWELGRRQGGDGFLVMVVESRGDQSQSQEPTRAGCTSYLKRNHRHLSTVFPLRRTWQGCLCAETLSSLASARTLVACLNMMMMRSGKGGPCEMKDPLHVQLGVIACDSTFFSTPMNQGMQHVQVRVLYLWSFVPLQAQANRRWELAMASVCSCRFHMILCRCR